LRERSIVNAWPRWLLNMKHALTLQNLRGNGALWHASIKTLKILRHNQGSPPPGRRWALVPTANPKRLTATANRLILAPDERSLQVDLVRRTPWLWTLAYGHHEDRTPTHGYETTREAAMAAFAKRLAVRVVFND
jgi:hypothetical protein